MVLWLLLNLGGNVWAQDFAALCADRTATEHVYYEYRLGTKPPFEQTMPPALVEKLVRADLHKEAVLGRIYGVRVSPAMLAAEVQRINTTTRAPDVLAGLKAALGNDTNRFAQAVARPILVERILRDKFANDASLHAPQRRQAETIRTSLLAAGRDRAEVDGLLSLFKQLGSNQLAEVSWQLGQPPEQPPTGNQELIEVQKRFGPNARLLSSPLAADKPRELYFEEKICRRSCSGCCACNCGCPAM